MTDLIKGTVEGESQTEALPINPADSISPPPQSHSTSVIGTTVTRTEADEQSTKDNKANVSVSQEEGQITGSAQPDAANKPQRPKSAKPTFQTIEQFIEYAYSKKGKPVSLNKKDERTIAVGPKLDDEAKARLFQLAQEDILLSVPRQLLFVAMQTDSAKVRGELREFVGESLRRHKAFGSDSLIAALRNLSDAPPIDKAIELAASIRFPTGDAQQRPLKSSDLAKLRSNAANTLAVWFAVTRNASLAELSRGLFSALWYPQTRKTQSEHVQLRILSQISDLAGIGIACQSFKSEAEREASFAQSARRDKERALERIAALERDDESQSKAIQEKDQEIEELNKNLAEQKTVYENALTIQRDKFFRLRGRIRERLRADVSMLDDALYALRKDPPKVDVMDDHAERVAEALRSEIKKLEEAE